MKKVFFVAALAVIGLSSCSKDYTCTCEFLGVESVTEYEGLNRSEADEAETACNTIGCDWAEA